MLKDNELIGVISIYRQEVRSFTDKQIALVTNFAAQAVIAIENARLLNEVRESLKQQTATSEVLGVISRSKFELRPILQSVVDTASQLCRADVSVIFRLDGGVYRFAAGYSLVPAYIEHERQTPISPGPGTLIGRAALSRQVVQIEDAWTDPLYEQKAAAKIAGGRSMMGVPLMRDGEPIGVIGLSRSRVDPFTQREIELVTTFADQAVIAIENVRLFEAEQQRTRELTKSLERQTATSEVLEVISRSPGNLQLVLEAMLEKAVRICDAKFGNIYRWDGELLHLLAAHNTPPALVKARRQSGIRATSFTCRMVETKTAVHVADLAADEAYTVKRDPTEISGVELGGVRTLLIVPMLKENEFIGSFSLYRQEVRPFTDKQIELVQNFAAQAVIAIENARLLSELRKSLEQQTATADVLRVISNSPGELEPVFEAMLKNAVRICEAKFGLLFLSEGDSFRTVALHGAPPAYAEARRREPVVRGNPGTALARAAATKQVVQIADIRSEPAYVSDPRRSAVLELAGARTMLVVPMLKEDALVGVVAIYRQEVRPFTDKQIELVRNFAAQAVIAIENTRLLNELRQRTDELGRSIGELRALGEVSQAVNSTLDLETVLSTIVAKAVQLSGTEAGAIYVFDEVQRELHLRATYGMDQELIDTFARQRIGLDETTVAQALAQREPVQIADLKQGPSSALYEIILRAGFRAVLVAPLLRGEEIVGLLVVRRRTPGTFPKNTIDLIKTFAAQSAVAIENARLFQNVETSLEDLRTTQDRLVQTQKLASLGQLTAGIAHEIKNPLNFVNNFSGVSAELIDELREALGRMTGDDKTRREIVELSDTLRDNLDKIVQHGKRADAIVKNMLLHSREGSGEHRPVNVNALVEESLNLAYHGARAEKQGFKMNMERSFDPAAGQVDVYPQEITRALLNLISNGFYAATKRKEQSNNDACEPTLVAATKNLGDKVEIRIRDNGSGIPPEAREKMFNPFFTTKPAGEGTGLGLSITHDIIVKQHSGSIEVDTQPGEFTEIRIILPRTATFIAESGGRA